MLRTELINDAGVKPWWCALCNPRKSRL